LWEYVVEHDRETVPDMQVVILGYHHPTYAEFVVVD
jgi:hypothetical protein